MNRTGIRLTCAAVLWTCAPARAALFRSITAETSFPSNATVLSSGSLTESGVTYTAIFKPSTPPPSYVHLPVVDATRAYNGHNSIGFRIDPTPNPSPTGTDKVQLRISHAGDSSDLHFDNTRYLGFAVYIPSTNFAIAPGTQVELAQYFQGAPYGPPLSLDVTGSTSGGVTWELEGLNNVTLGNPSSPRIDIADGTMAFNTWTTFVVKSLMDFNNNGQVALWQNQQQLAKFNGSIGYDPTTIPYKNPPDGTANPNSAFDVFFGPYRNQQPTTEQLFFDDIRWADTLTDATPTSVPEPQALSVLAITLGACLGIPSRVPKQSD